MLLLQVAIGPRVGGAAAPLNECQLLTLMCYVNTVLLYIMYIVSAHVKPKSPDYST